MSGLDTGLNGRAQAAIVASWAVIGFTAAMLVLEVSEAVGLIDYGALDEGLAQLVAFAGGGYTIAFIVSVVLVAMWIHRAHANLAANGIEGEFTPGWAVGWYFIPIANLFKPFQAMRELWNASLGQDDSYAAEAPGEVKAWWAAWIVGNILSNVAFRMTGFGGTEIGSSQAQVAAWISAASSLVMIAAGFWLIGLIRSITTAQTQGLGMAEVFS